jgi:type VI secretion system secreted protein VgrG
MATGYTQPMDGVMDVSDTSDNTESADALTFNADAAAQQLMDHVDGNLKPGEQCATFVREAIAVGGININPHPLDAEDYGPYLLNRGFEVVSPDSYEPQTGDIAVIQNYPGGNPSGHITMFTGSQWLSDYVQRDMWGGHGYRINQPSYKIYRSKNIK